MDIKCPLITDENGAWQYQIGDKYYKLSEIISSLELYRDSSLLKDAIDAFKHTSFTGELSEEDSARFIAKANEQTLLLNTKEVYDSLMNSIASSPLENAPDHYAAVVSLIKDMYNSVSGRASVHVNARSIDIDGIVPSYNGADYTLRNFILMDNPGHARSDLRRLGEDLTKAFYTVRGGKIEKTDPLIDAMEAIKGVKSQNVDISEPDNNANVNNSIVQPVNELDTDTCYLLGEIVAKFLIYADAAMNNQVHSGVISSDIESDSEYYGGIFSSSDYEVISSVRDDICYHSDSPIQRIARAADEIYPVVDSLKDYVLGVCTKDNIRNKVNALDNLIRNGVIKLQAVEGDTRS